MRLASLLLTMNGYETVKIKLKHFKYIKPFKVLAVLFLFSAPPR